MPLCDQNLVFINLLGLSGCHINVPSCNDQSTQQQGLAYFISANGDYHIQIKEYLISPFKVTVSWHPWVGLRKELARVINSLILYI